MIPQLFCLLSPGRGGGEADGEGPRHGRGLDEDPSQTLRASSREGEQTGQRWRGKVATAVSLALLAPAVHAETLADAIALAYRSNPALQQNRAQQRALDESYVQARAGLRPTAGFSVVTTYTRTDLGNAGAGSLVPNGAGGYATVGGGGRFESNDGQAALSLTQPIYNGGRTAAAVSAAEAGVLAGREGLRQTEANVLQQVVQAFMDVRRDQEIVGIRRADVAVLQNQLDETRARFEAGQITRTDVAQAQAGLAASRALLTTAQAQAQISRAAYTAVVGQNPEELVAPGPLPGLPPDVDKAFDIAIAANPTLRQAMRTEEASRARIAEARGLDRPTLAASASVGYTGSIAPFDARNYDRAITGSLTFTQPLFTGGLNHSQVRAAIEQNTSDRIGVEGARRSVVQTVSQAWNALLANHANVGSDSEQVSAAAIAAEGTREEYRAGLRITLDVLTAEQTLRSAQLSLVQARHDEYVSQAVLLAALGRLEAASLVAGAPAYDPAQNFDRVRHAGTVPWEGVVAALDRAGEASSAGPARIPTPAEPIGPPTLRPAAPTPVNAAPSTVTPTTSSPSPSL